MAATGTFPKGSTEANLSHSQAAEREAPKKPAPSYIDRGTSSLLHSKGVFWQPNGVQEFVVKAFLMKFHQIRRPDEANRKPTWVSPAEAKRRLAKGVK